MTRARARPDRGRVPRSRLEAIERANRVRGDVEVPRARISEVAKMTRAFGITGVARALAFIYCVCVCINDDFLPQRALGALVQSSNVLTLARTLDGAECRGAPL